MTPVVLHTLPGAWGTRSVSPFCTKLEAWLVVAGVPYTLARANPQASPKGKVPYVRDGDAWIGDSQLVIRHLEATRGVSLDRHLSPAAAARAHLVRRTIEEGTYFSGLWLRWGRDDAWPVQRDTFAAFMPPVVRWVLPGILRRRMRGVLVAQGTGRHEPEVIESLAKADFDAFAAALGDDPFFGGDRPCTTDLVLYAFADGVLRYPVPSTVQAHLAGLATLVALRDRVAERISWPAPVA